MVMFKKVKSFEVVFNDPEKVYGSGEKVAGRVVVEVCEVTRVKAVRVLACGVAKVLWMQGSQQCKQTLEYLRYEDTLLLEDQPTGEGPVLYGAVRADLRTVSTRINGAYPKYSNLLWLSGLNLVLHPYAFYNLQHPSPPQKSILSSVLWCPVLKVIPVGFCLSYLKKLFAGISYSACFCFEMIAA